MVCCINSVGAHHHWHMAFLKYQQRFIAHIANPAVFSDNLKSNCVSAIAAGDDAHFEALKDQAIDQGHGEGRFATSACHHVAHDHHSGIDAVLFQETQFEQKLTQEERDTVKNYG